MDPNSSRSWISHRSLSIDDMNEDRQHCTSTIGNADIHVIALKPLAMKVPFQNLTPFQWGDSSGITV